MSFLTKFKKINKLPSLKRSQELQRVIDNDIHFSYSKKEDILKDLQDEIRELTIEIDEQDINKNNNKRISEELGDVLFVLGNLANRYNIDCNKALLSSIKEYERRIIFCEKHYNGDIKNIEPNEMIRLWKKSKSHKN